MKSYEINGFLFYWFLSKSKKEIISLYRTHSVQLYKVFHYEGTPPPPTYQSKSDQPPTPINIQSLISMSIDVVGSFINFELIKSII